MSSITPSPQARDHAEQLVPTILASPDSNISAWDEIKLVQDSALKVWTIYMQWYTWFFGTEMLSFGLVLNALSGPMPTAQAKSVAQLLAYLWIFCSTLGIGSSIFIGVYSYSSSMLIIKLGHEIRDRDHLSANSILPKWPAYYGVSANVLALSSGVVIWLLLIPKLN